MARQISTIQNKTANPATAPALSTFASFRSNRKAKNGWSSLQFDRHAAQRYRRADNIIAGRSLTGHAIAL
jgi:hypothetical protein